jgi:hypothetical protein
MADILSKVFGPTDSVADTLTALIPTAGYQAPMDMTITRLRVGKGNVVNAKECAGFITVTVDGVVGSPFAVAYGNGQGGASNSSSIAAEEIPVQIPVPKNSMVIVKVLDAEVAKDFTVAIMCSAGLSNPMMTMCAGGAGQDTTADTALTLTENAKLLGSKMTPFRNGRIKTIRFCGAGVIDAKAGSAKLALEISGYPYPLEFAVGGGPSGATLGVQAPTDVINGLDIPVSQNSTVVAKVTSAEIMLSASVSLIAT